jgi:hypothetical protein
MVKRVAQILLVLIAIIAVNISCEKEALLSIPLSPQDVKVLPDPDIKWAMDAVAGDGVVLLTYVDQYNTYQFKLVDNAGDSIWTKDFGYKFEVAPPSGQNPATSDTIINILYDIDKTFSIFRGSSLKKINLKGEVVFSDPNFLNGIESANITKVMLGNDNNYLALGEVELSGNRAFASEYTRIGQQEFITFHTINVNGTNTFTDAQLLDNGDYLLSGSFNTASQSISSSFFTAVLNPNGVLGVVNNNFVEGMTSLGRQLFRTKENTYIYLLSAIDENAQDTRSRVYHLNSSGEALDVDFLDLAVFNFGTAKSLLQNQDGSFLGLMKTDNEIPDFLATGLFGNISQTPNTYTVPNYTYFFTLNDIGGVQSKSYFDRNYSNYFNVIIRLSNGKILIYGALQSLGEEVKLAYLIRES